MRRLLLVAAALIAASHAAADPRTDYLLYCRGCHLANGESVPPQVPSLHNLGPLLESEAGREYIIRVPGVTQNPLSDARLAAVLNWVMTSFNAGSLPEGYKPFTPEEVGAARGKVLEDPLRYRADILAR